MQHYHVSNGCFVKVSLFTVHIVYIVCSDSVLVILPLYNTTVGFKSVSEDVIEA